MTDTKSSLVYWYVARSSSHRRGHYCHTAAPAKASTILTYAADQLRPLGAGTLVRSAGAQLAGPREGLRRGG